MVKNRIFYFQAIGALLRRSLPEKLFIVASVPFPGKTAYT
jgi:hypothetical protein